MDDKDMKASLPTGGWFGRLAAALLLMASTAALAQSVPSGSPVDRPESSSSDRSDDQASANPGELSAVPSVVYQPTALGPNTPSAEPVIDQRVRTQDNVLTRNLSLRPRPAPGEFEAFVNAAAGRTIPRFGEELLLPENRDFATPATATVPADYRLNVGDAVTLYLTGSVGGTVEREIDTNGNIFLPSVGTIRLAGVRYGDLRETVIRAIGMEYRYFDVSVAVKSLRGVRVYVTGMANNPGAFTVNSLSTLVNAVLQAGGPAAGGSFRSIKLYRNGREVADFDLYTLLRDGLRTNDMVLQNEDVLFIPPAGEQVAVLGSVQREAIFELKPGETLADVLRLAGGPNDLADPGRMILVRTAEAEQIGPLEIASIQFPTTLARGGDIMQILSRGSLIQPVARQSVVVRVEGEVNRPGDYFVAPNTPLSQVMEMAGGPTDRAFLFGSRLERRSVRDQQSASFAEAIEQMEMTLASAPLTADRSDGQFATELASARQVLELMRQRQPDGRVVMNISASSPALPQDLLLEHQDRLVIPATPTTVGVFGAVYRPASFLIEGRTTRLRDYIERAGGLQRSGDRRRMFVVRANGDVLTRRNGMLNAPALPGDVIFVPVHTRGTDVWQRIRDIAAIVFQFGVTAAAVSSIN